MASGTRPSRTSPKAPVRARGVRTRAALIDAARRVFERDGYLEARVADIAAAAGVAHGSFYTYFDSKDDVFREMVTGVMDDFLAALDEGLPGTGAERIRAAIRRYLELYRRRAPILGVVEQVGALASFHELRRQLRHRSVQRLERLIRGLAADGEARLQDLDAHALAWALVGMLDTFAYAWFVLGEPFDEPAAEAALDAIWLRALGLQTP
ncbi:MAG: TetR/AcrR family transcriptional regulator [Solirubrobacteraceae bacterium]